jgi:acyl carrier protein phosphodiesterase
MNYLAHLLLSGDNLDRQVGGLLGDFVKGPLTGAYPLDIQQGIVLHRKIDSLLAKLPCVTQLLPLFEGPWRRYAGIVIDIAFDHLLALHWHRHHPQPLSTFCGAFYQHLHFRRNLLPENAREFCQNAIQMRWLESYVDAELMPIILDRVGSRFHQPIRLGDAWEKVADNREIFEDALSLTVVELKPFAQAYFGTNSGTNLVTVQPFKKGKSALGGRLV